MERDKHLHERLALVALALLLQPRSDSSHVISRSRMTWRRSTLDVCTVDQVQLDDTSSTARRQPGQEEDVRVKQGLTSLPSVRRRGVNVQIPQQA